MSNSDLLASWLADEARVREIHERGRGSDAVSPEHIAQMSGMEMLQAMLAGRLPAARIGATMDFCLIEAKAGEAIFQGAPSARFANPMGGLHGGWYATLLDSALGCAVHTLMPAGRGYTTAELGVNLVRAIGPKVERVRAIGKVLHCGRQLATAEAKLVGPDGTLYAHGTTTCLVFEMKKAA